METYKNLAYGIGDLTPKEFKTYTPAEFFDYIEAKAEWHRAQQEEKEREFFDTNFRFGMICAVLANINRDEKKRREPFEPGDFLPVQKAEDVKVVEEQTADEQLQSIEMLNNMLGGKINP